jgi:hypothetical protein
MGRNDLRQHIAASDGMDFVPTLRRTERQTSWTCPDVLDIIESSSDMVWQRFVNDDTSSNRL